MVMDNSIRKFNPDAVKLEHLNSKMLLYGSDVPGIRMRLDVFRKILVNSGYDVISFKTIEEALPFLQTGSLFSPNIYVIIENIDSALKTKMESKHLLKKFVSLLDSYDNNSYIIMGLLGNPSSAAQFKVIYNYISKKCEFGIVREVLVPVTSKMDIWIKNYAESLGYDFDPPVISKLSACSSNNFDKAANAIEMLGEELDCVSPLELSEWMDSSKKIQLYELENAIAFRNINVLLDYRRTLTDGLVGDRLFLLKARYVITDLLLSCLDEKNSLISFKSFKSSQYSSYQNFGAYKTKEKAINNGGVERFMPMYFKVCSLIEKMSGFDNSVPMISTIDECYAVLVV